jgi:hypothetical protein
VSERVACAARSILQESSDARVVEVIHMRSMSMVAIGHGLRVMLLLLLLDVVLHLGVHLRVHLLRLMISTRGQWHDILLHTIHIRSLTSLRAEISISILLLALLFSNNANQLQLPAQHHPKRLPPNWLLHPGDARTIPPFVEFSAEGVGLCFEGAERCGGEEAVAARGVDVCDA